MQAVCIAAYSVLAGFSLPSRVLLGIIASYHAVWGCLPFLDAVGRPSSKHPLLVSYIPIRVQCLLSLPYTAPTLYSRYRGYYFVSHCVLSHQRRWVACKPANNQVQVQRRAGSDV